MVKNGSLSETSVSLIWKPGDDGGLQQTFVLQYREMPDHDFVNITVEDTGELILNSSIASLNPGTDYIAQVYSINTLGVSNVADSILFTTRSYGM